jgi:general secretion pathway protein G
MRKRNSKGFTLIELLIVVAIIGIIAAIAIPNLLNAIDRGKQKRTMADLRSIGTAVESYAVDNNIYPTANSVAALRPFLEPIYIKIMPQTDGWKGTFQVDSVATMYTVFSQGKGSTTDNCNHGTTQLFTEDICFSNGQFIKSPEGTQQ